MLTPYHFFLKHAGYGYDPQTETPMQGRIRCAQSLARAEKSAIDCSFTWDSCDIDSSEFSEDPDPWQLWRCHMRNEKGVVVESLHGIDFGRDGEPWGDPYRRVVEAELALGYFHAN